MNSVKGDLADWLLEAQSTDPSLNIRPSQPLERPTIHYSELPEDPANDSVAGDWNFYRQEAGRLLAEGNEGRWILIHNQKIIGIWKTREEADRVRLGQFFMQNVLMKQILEREPVLRGGGYNRQWH